MGSRTSRFPAKTPWFAEPSGDGFYRVMDCKFVVLAEKCCPEVAWLFAAAPDLLEAVGRLMDVLLTPEEGYAIRAVEVALMRVHTPENDE